MRDESGEVYFKGRKGEEHRGEMGRCDVHGVEAAAVVSFQIITRIPIDIKFVDS